MFNTRLPDCFGFIFIQLTSWPYSIVGVTLHQVQFLFGSNNHWESTQGTSKKSYICRSFLTTIPVKETTEIKRLNILISVPQKGAVFFQRYTSSIQFAATTIFWWIIPGQVTVYMSDTMLYNGKWQKKKKKEQRVTQLAPCVSSSEEKKK